MDVESLRVYLNRCTREYANAGALIRSQGKPFMEPLLFLLAGLVEAQEQASQERGQLAMAAAMAGCCKAKNCASGSESTCAGHGCAAEKLIEAGSGQCTQAAEQGPASGSGLRPTCTGHGFPQIEG